MEETVLNDVYYLEQISTKLTHTNAVFEVFLWVVFVVIAFIGASIVYKIFKWVFNNFLKLPL